MGRGDDEIKAGLLGLGVTGDVEIVERDVIM